MILNNIKRLCSERNISICALEKEVGLGNGSISYWEKGYPRVDILKRVADYFGCTVDDLLKEESQ